SGNPPQGIFTLELTSDDVGKILEETRHRTASNIAGNFNYLMESGNSIQLTLDELKEIGATATASESISPVPAFRKINGYTPPNERFRGGILLDVSNQYGYFGTSHEPGRILKVALGATPETPPVVVGAAVFEGEEDNPFTELIDAKNGYAYFATDF